jgi:flagellar basal body-associated protein FliL
MKKLIGDPNVYPWIIIFAVLILFLALGNAFGQSLLESGGSSSTSTNYTGGSTVVVQPEAPTTTSTTTPSFTTNLLNTLRHPKVLGLLFVFLVGMFTLLFLTKTPKQL